MPQSKKPLLINHKQSGVIAGKKKKKRHSDLAKVGVEGSNPFARSNFLPTGKSLTKARRAGGLFVMSSNRKPEKLLKLLPPPLIRAMRFFAHADVVSFSGLGYLNSD
jgi:hypothetical protein